MLFDLKACQCAQSKQGNLSSTRAEQKYAVTIIKCHRSLERYGTVSCEAVECHDHAAPPRGPKLLRPAAMGSGPSLCHTWCLTFLPVCEHVHMPRIRIPLDSIQYGLQIMPRNLQDLPLATLTNNTETKLWTFRLANSAKTHSPAYNIPDALWHRCLRACMQGCDRMCSSVSSIACLGIFDGRSHPKVHYAMLHAIRMRGSCIRLTHTCLNDGLPLKLQIINW